ncbi:MAG: glycosyltransferase [Coriobacteriia bacterium]|nr:glycosyltransferase [Coriobacteriia bacterium]
MPATTKPLVSVLTPSYNQAQWLADNLRSVACQTYPAIEHVIMDGGSTDGTVGLLEAAGTSVIWRSEPDEGQADAINKAFTASSGEIVGWINSDDAYFDREVIEDVVEFFGANPDVDVVYGHGLQTTADGAAIQVLWSPPFDPELLSAVDFITQPTAFVRRSALSEPMLDRSFHFALDYELWLRLLRGGSRFARIDRFTAIDRHQAQRKSTTIKDVHAADLERLAERYDTRFGSEFEGVRTAWYRRQRLMGATLIGRIRGDLAFTAPPDAKRGLLRRQAFTRRSNWPAEYR